MTPGGNTANKLDTGIVWLGRAISWCVPVMALLVLVIVVLRYGFNTGAIAAQESVQYLHAAIFMLGAAVTLGADQHVRVDIFYRSFTPRQRHGSTHWATSFSHCRFALSLDGVLGLRCGQLVSEEASPEPGGLPFVYLLKGLIPAMAALLALQALSQPQRSDVLRKGCAVMEGQLALAMFVAVCAILLLGFPVALTLGAPLWLRRARHSHRAL